MTSSHVGQHTAARNLPPRKFPVRTVLLLLPSDNSFLHLSPHVCLSHSGCRKIAHLKVLVSITASSSQLSVIHVNLEMASKDHNSSPDLYSFSVPTLALKQALCFSCWDVSSNLSRCSACKRVSYCSVKCQKQDWSRNHKKICKKLVALNKQMVYLPSAGRRWNDYHDEQVYR